MKTLRLVLAVAAALTFLPSPPASGDSPQRRNPIQLEGQIREISGTGDGVTIRLHRDRYPIVASSVTRVRWLDGRRARPEDLQNSDSIRVEGDLDRDVIYADRVTILRRDERRGGN
ncbi:MAG TPA: hypothetical protein VGF28_01455 [Thermoanaerobaculia bacterium]|jgi:hypothetical protein